MDSKDIEIGFIGQAVIDIRYKEVMCLELSEKLKFNLSKSLIDSLYRKNLITIEEKDKILHKISKKYNINYEYTTLT